MSSEPTYKELCRLYGERIIRTLLQHTVANDPFPDSFAHPGGRISLTRPEPVRGAQ